ncbi:MAG TPA: hypothetical protein PKJ45_04045 [Rubrivivax sp.]|nr:hypothetical protein [Rubrivivax sp.]
MNASLPPLSTPEPRRASPQPGSTRSGHRCPECGGAVMRVLRSANDKRRWDADDWRRYRCRDAMCNWQGLLSTGGRRRREPRPARGAVQLARRIARILLALLLALGVGAAALLALQWMLQL